jgi:hypothetical protein
MCNIIRAVESPIRGYNDLQDGFEGLWNTWLEPGRGIWDSSVVLPGVCGASTSPLAVLPNSIEPYSCATATGWRRESPQEAARALQLQQFSMIYAQSRLSTGARWPTLDREAGTTLTPLRCFGKSVKGGATLSELPPPVGEEEFQAVDTTNEGAIREYFHDFIDELHTFLNTSPCLRDVQRIRRRWRRGSKASYPFGEDSFVVQSRHWYTRNIGGRNEAQFNVGMFPRYLRVGLGFEFTERAHGKPAEVQPVWGQFREILREDRQAFEQKRGNFRSWSNGFHGTPQRSSTLNRREHWDGCLSPLGTRMGFRW